MGGLYPYVLKILDDKVLIKIRIMKKRIFTLISLFTLVCAGLMAQTGAERFYMGVTGYDGTQSATISATVFDNFIFKIQMPESGEASKVGAGKAKLEVRMTDVPTLSVSGVHTYTHEYVSPLTAKKELSEYLSNLYSFRSATAPVEVRDDDGSDTFTYTITKEGNIITGTPSVYEDAHNAWKRLTSHVESGTSDGDTRSIIKKGTFVQIGDEKMTFNSDATVFNGEWTYSSESDKVISATSVETGIAKGADTYKAIISLPAGSEIVMGNCYALLKDSATITIDLSAKYDDLDLTKVISSIRDAADRQERVIATFTAINDLLAICNGANADILVDFTAGEPVITVYPATENPLPEKQTVAQFNEILKTIPNAVGFVDAADADKAEGAEKNLVVDYKVGKGHYYECDKFVLTDKKDFYSPVDFEALSLSYSRTNASGFNSVCLPFDYDSSDVSGNIHIFSNYNESDQTLYFRTVTKVPEPGYPCIVESSSDSWSIEKTDVTIKAQPINANMLGMYIKARTGEGYYKLDGTGTKFEHTTATSTCTPFRSYVSIDKDNPFGAKPSVLDVVWGDDVTSIDSVSATKSAFISNIYSVSGAEQNSLKAGVNVVKMNDGSVRKVIIK